MHLRSLPRWLPPLLLPVVILAAIAWRQQPDGRLHVFFLPTGGDAALVRTPGGQFILIDGGSDPAALATLVGRLMPFWRRELAAVVLTSPRSGWLPGQVATLARYRARVALAPPLRGGGPLVAEWRRLLAEAGTPLRIARPGARLAIDGVTLAVIAPGDGEEAGLALRITYGRTSLLFDGAAGADEDERLAAEQSPAQAVVLPWERPLPEGLLARLRPRALIFSDALQLKRPAELTTLDRAIGGAAVYHEAIHGAIELVSDGARLEVRTERGER